MAITKSKLISDFLYFIKNDLGNITDPISSSRTPKSKFILTAYPQRPVQYPIITIKNTNIEARRSGMQTTNQDITIHLEIRIWARNQKEKDEISQDVLNRLTDIQFTANTGSVANNIHDLNIGSAVEIDDPGEPGGKAGIKSRIFQVVYRFYNA